MLPRLRLRSLPLRKLLITALGVVAALLVVSYINRRPSPLPGAVRHSEALATGGAELVTLATHLTVDRFPALQQIVTRWAGPIAIAFLLKNPLDDIARIEELLAQDATLSQRLSYCTYSSNDGASYPVNILRNRVMRIVSTPYMFLVDVDFVPDEHLFDDLKRELQNAPADAIYVVPCFEYLAPNVSAPGDKRAVRTGA